MSRVPDIHLTCRLVHGIFVVQHFFWQNAPSQVRSRYSAGSLRLNIDIARLLVCLIAELVSSALSAVCAEIWVFYGEFNLELSVVNLDFKFRTFERVEFHVNFIQISIFFFFGVFESKIEVKAIDKGPLCNSFLVIDLVWLLAIHGQKYL